MITVFTPSYNRASFLSNLYKKLLNQTCQDFVWMIVDDGSTDQTKEVVSSFIKEKKIIIKYIYQENHGKQAAVNRALDECETEWFAFCDSDDWYLPNTIEEMTMLIASRERENWAGIVARRCDENLNFKNFHKINFDKKQLPLPVLYTKYKFHAETCAVFLTGELRKAKYPTIQDKFIPESFMFDRFSQRNEILFINKAWSVSSYHNDGLTVQSNRLYHQNVTGVLCALIEATRTKYGLLKDIKNYIAYYFWKKKYKTRFEINETVPNFVFKARYILSFVIIPFLAILKKPSWIWKK